MGADHVNSPFKIIMESKTVLGINSAHTMTFPKIKIPTMASATDIKYVKMRAYGMSFDESNYLASVRIDFELLSDYVFHTNFAVPTTVGGVTKPNFGTNLVGEP